MEGREADCSAPHIGTETEAVLIAVRTKLFLVGETARESRLMADAAAMQLLIEVLARIS